MELNASRIVECSEETWGAEPNLRAEHKMEIAMNMARMLRTRDLIEWQVKDLGGKMIEVTGTLRVGEQG